ncbi:hypothetical protein FH972_021147 [Carpinus fangiana]|uniref:Uncharacterized protein n=1 Tax=Carpinus fangiana TaxID=176857 RepID=A0A5N6KP23_9ROSI|nr:hypothetical protein FH972_021147 [Carpinus fangiana]
MTLQSDYPWTQSPLVTSAPMRIIAGAKLACATSEAGGLGFIGAGTDMSVLPQELSTAAELLSSSANKKVASHHAQTGQLPVGVGIICHKASLDELLAALNEPGRIPAAIWLFAPDDPADLKRWTERIRETTKAKPSKIWIQVGGVKEAVQVSKSCAPEALVVQGIDAGGHGLQDGASIVSLLPEVADALEAAKARGHVKHVPALIAAGGIADGRGVAAALALGAQGVCLGTRYLASEEAVIAKGYSDEIIRADDGGQTTVRSKVYDTLRGTTHWPERYGGRGVTNATFHDWNQGMDLEQNKQLYESAVKAGDSGWGPQGRMTTYAGTAVGLVKTVQKASDITAEVREDSKRILGALAHASS